MFHLGLYMSNQWLKYLIEDQHDFQELKMFINALESGRDIHGSGWLDLTARVRRWLDELEEESEFKS